MVLLVLLLFVVLLCCSLLLYAHVVCLLLMLLFHSLDTRIEILPVTSTGTFTSVTQQQYNQYHQQQQNGQQQQQNGHQQQQQQQQQQNQQPALKGSEHLIQHVDRCRLPLLVFVFGFLVHESNPHVYVCCVVGGVVVVVMSVLCLLRVSVACVCHSWYSLLRAQFKRRHFRVIALDEVRSRVVCMYVYVYCVICCGVLFVCVLYVVMMRFVRVYACVVFV